MSRRLASRRCGRLGECAALFVTRFATKLRGERWVTMTPLDVDGMNARQSRIMSRFASAVGCVSDQTNEFRIDEYSLARLIDRCGFPPRACDGTPPSRLIASRRTGIKSNGPSRVARPAAEVLSPVALACAIARESATITSSACTQTQRRAFPLCVLASSYSAMGSTIGICPFASAAYTPFREASGTSGVRFDMLAWLSAVATFPSDSAPTRSTAWGNGHGSAPDATSMSDRRHSSRSITTRCPYSSRPMRSARSWVSRSAGPSHGASSSVSWSTRTPCSSNCESGECQLSLSSTITLNSPSCLR